MKKSHLFLFFTALMMLSGCGFTPSYAPKNLNGYVIDMLTTKSVEEQNDNKREVYRYQFSDKTFKATSTSYPNIEGSYRYDILNPQQARLTCIIESEKKKTNIIKMVFQDSKSGTWVSYINNNTPGEQGGTFVIVQKGSYN